MLVYLELYYTFLIFKRLFFLQSVDNLLFKMLLTNIFSGVFVKSLFCIFIYGKVSKNINKAKLYYLSS